MNKQYDKANLFGVVVVFDDIALSREKMYDKVFGLYKKGSGELDIGEQNYIHSHIKVVSLRQIEIMILQNGSFLPCILLQEKNPEMWDNLNFVTVPTTNGLIPAYSNYVQKLKDEIINLEEG